MEHLPHLLQFPSMPEAMLALMWRLPALRELSLAGSCCHPSKLKLLAASCGGTVTHLDLSTGSTFNLCAACRCSGFCGGCAAGAPRQVPGPAYRRLTSRHERDLCEAAQGFRRLTSFSAAGSALPLRVCTAFVAAAPAGRLERLDLSSCCLEAEPTTGATYAQPSWQRPLCFSSGARRSLNFDELPSVTGNSVSRLQQMHAETESWQRPATAGRFAAALRRHGGSLRSLRLGGAGGVTDRHLSSLRSLEALTHLCLASVTAVSAALLTDAAASCPALHHLDISGTAADDACLAAAGMPPLRALAAAGCARCTSAGVAALAAGPAAVTLRWLDLSHTGADDAAAAELAERCGSLQALHLTGCELMPAAVERLRQLSSLRNLSLGRWVPADGCGGV